MEPNKNNQLIDLEKETLFSKIKKFFKNLFSKNTEVEVVENEIMIESAPSPSQIDLMREQYVSEKADAERILEIQERYEKGEYDLSMLTDEEIVDLMYLYHTQTLEYKKKTERINKRLAKLKV